MSAVRIDRVVAVAATLRDGREQLGSGYLISGRLVLTAGHCTRDKATGEAAARLGVVRASDGAVANVAEVVSDRELDVAVLHIADDAPWGTDLPFPAFARVDQSQSGVLEDCTGIGFPLFQRDPDQRTRHTSEFHGTIYQTDEWETGHLLMREPLIRPGPVTDSKAETLSSQVEKGPSPWGGLSGALMFYHSSAIGVVVEHHPRQGDNALRAIGFARIAATSAKIRQWLHLPGPDSLPFPSKQAAAPLVGLAELIDDDDLPLLAKLDPYRLGATPTEFGDKDNYGHHDPYVPRTRNTVDSRLRTALRPGRLVLLVGPSKSGKTRTAFEAAQHSWPQARVLAPTPTGLDQLVTHPRLQSTADPVVVWLDDLQRFLTGTHPLTPAMLARLLSRPGSTVVLATLRQEERARLTAATGELTRDTRRLLDDARDTTFELGPTSDDPDEQATARATYPTADLSTTGLAEQLAGAPALLSQYHDARYSDPLLHAVMQTAIDWARAGMPGPIRSGDLATLAIDALLSDRPDLEPNDQQIAQAITTARTPPEGAGRVAALRTVLLPNRKRGYRPFDYLVAADDGQTGQPRAIPDPFWDQALACANPDDAFAVGLAAFQRDNTPAAIRANHQAASTGHTAAMNNLASLLADWLDPPELAEARTWYQKAADAGDTEGMVSLGNLLADRLDPPELAEARTWYQKAADAGNTIAAYDLGILLADQLDPPELAEARTWFQKAADAGNTIAAYNVGALSAALGDADGASRAWHTVIDRDGQFDLVAAAAQALAAVSALQDDLQSARELLNLARTRGSTFAGRYAAALETDRLVRTDARQQLHELSEDTDALNFLGIAAYIDGQYDQARSYWIDSSDLGDVVSQLLLHLTTDGSPPTHA